MSKKLIIAILAVLLAAGAALYFFVLRDTGGEDRPADLYNYAIKDSFVTNVKDSSKLFKTTVILVSNQKGLDEYFSSNQYVVRDTILFILRGLTEEDIKNGYIQDNLRVSIPQALNEALHTEYVVSVYFSDFVMQ